MLNSTWLKKGSVLNFVGCNVHEKQANILKKPILHPHPKAIATSKLKNSCAVAGLNSTILNANQFPSVVEKRQYSSKKDGNDSTSEENRRPSLAEELVRVTDDPLYDTTQVPSFQEYFHKSHLEKSSKTLSTSPLKRPGTGNTGEDITGPRLYTYVMVGAAGMLASVGAKNSIINLLSTLAPTSRVVAAGRIEVDLAGIPEAKNMVVKWRGKPVFIRHRTDAEVQEAEAVDWKKLRDPESDAERTQNPKWLIMVGVCTHLGCIPIGEAGDYGGWYCPCHGSHYDISGRIRRGPAPLNMEIPPYEFLGSERIAIG